MKYIKECKSPIETQHFSTKLTNYSLPKFTFFHTISAAINSSFWESQRKITKREVYFIRLVLLVGGVCVLAFGIILHFFIPNLPALLPQRVAIVTLLFLVVGLSWYKNVQVRLLFIFHVTIIVFNWWMIWTAYFSNYAMDYIVGLIIGFGASCAVMKTPKSLTGLVLTSLIVNVFFLGKADNIVFNKLNLLFFMSVLCFFYYFTFISKLKLQSDLKQFNHQLEEKIERRTQELNQLNKALKDSNNELEHFAYIASHDLKEPIRNIIGFVSLAKHRLKTAKPIDIEEYLHYAIKSAKQMNTLVEDVLEFSTLNRRKLKLQSTNVQVLISNIEANLKVTLAHKKARLHYKELPIIEANKGQLLLVFKNLIENGLKYNTHPTPTVTITYEPKEEQHLFCIRDNGIGIDEEYHSQVFEMFKRLHNRGDYDGTGIGLAVCKKVVEKHGGQVWVESSKNAGAAFYFTIPKKNNTQ